MSRVSLIQTNFTAGEISPKLMGRVDISRYNNSAKQLTNAHPLVYGGAVRRAGTRFVSPAKYGDKKVRLIPFVFSKNVSYILEFGHKYIRVLTSEGIVLTSGLVEAINGGASVYEKATQYTDEQLFELDFVQGADTLFITHKDHPVRWLRRHSNNDWRLSDVPFSPSAFDEIGHRPQTTLALTLTAATSSVAAFTPTDVGRKIEAGVGIAIITAFNSPTSVSITIDSDFAAPTYAPGDWSIVQSPKTGCKSSKKEPVGEAITLTLDAPGWRTSDIGAFVSINRGLVEITEVTTDTVVQARIIKALDADVKAPADAWSIKHSVWNEYDGYPSAVTISNQRLVLAGTKRHPQTVWLSVIGEYVNFTTGVDDSDAIAVAISANQINPIVQLASSQSLIIFTYGGEYSLTGSNLKSVTPTNLQVQDQSVYGSSQVRPVRIGNELYFVQRSGRKVRAMGYQFSTDAYGSADLTVLAEHITASGVKDMAYQQEPDSILWCVRNDGRIASVTVDRDQEVTGWAVQETHGEFESVAAIPNEAGDQLWVVVKRVIDGQTKRYIEVLKPGLNLDSTIFGRDSNGARTWTGLSHLEGEEVDVLADGSVQPSTKVSAGQITLPRKAVSVEIGLPYKTTIRTLTPEMQTQGGSAQGKPMRISEVSIRVLETSGCLINGDIVPFKQLGKNQLGRPPELFTGVKKIEQLGWEIGEAEIEIVQEQPLPIHVLSVTKSFTVNG